MCSFVFLLAVEGRLTCRVVSNSIGTEPSMQRATVNNYVQVAPYRVMMMRHDHTLHARKHLCGYGMKGQRMIRWFFVLLGLITVALIVLSNFLLYHGTMSSSPKGQSAQGCYKPLLALLLSTSVFSPCILHLTPAIQMRQSWFMYTAQSG